MGVKSKYTHKLADQICHLTATTTMGRADIANEIGLDTSTITRWIQSNRKLDGDDEKEDGFCTLYARAKIDQADFMVEEMFDIADDGTNDWEERKRGDGSEHIALNSEHIQRSRLRVDTRKWAAAKLNPKKYGDKTTLAGDPDNPLQTGLTVTFVNAENKDD